MRCPQGHTVHRGNHDNVECSVCDSVATSVINGEPANWMQLEEYQDACRRLQDQVDEAFDNQYFGGW